MSEVKEEYCWKELHNDLEKGVVCGVYGAANATYHGLAEIRAGVDMAEFHKKRSSDEVLIEEIDTHLRKESTQKNWSKISTFDPMGLWATRPTIAATRACMDLPELKDIDSDGKVVREDKGINVVKVAIEYVWNLPKLAKALKMDEKKMREALYKYTQIEGVKDSKYRAFVPPVGGLTVYFLGDLTKLSDAKTEVAVRVHDECNGSDVFCTDICTCRPYLIFSINAAVECAKRGGVGIIAYFRKEGRSLGEVTKFRVYNARKAQKGGDRPEMYFYQTESIAGIRDARFQEMMPDVFHWLGIERIDWLLSMSSDKYDAITGAGISVMQRVTLPDSFVPRDAKVEITAKVSAGYHTDQIPSDQIVGKLRTPEFIRVRCGEVFDLALKDKTTHFRLDMSKFDDVTKYVVKVIKEAYPDLKVPYHSRWRHFEVDGVDRVTPLINSWHCDEVEKVRRLVDLVTVSVLVDAGAGAQWKYHDANGKIQSRSEGLALASLEMFCEGVFSSDPALPFRVNSYALRHLTLHTVEKGFQISQVNKMNGLKGRYLVLKRLGKALNNNPDFFGREMPRPGNVVDYVLKHVKDGRVSVRVLWKAIVEGLEAIWPATLSGVQRGDVWVYNPLKKIGQPGSDLVPFHKLSQWLMLSMLECFERLNIQFDDMGIFTGLAEYRNGGLFVDFGVLTPKNQLIQGMQYDAGSELIVEWRALTVVLLDRTAESVRKALGQDEKSFPLAKVLEGGTWRAGRLIAQEKRAGGDPPILVRSDGTVF